MLTYFFKSRLKFSRKSPKTGVWVFVFSTVFSTISLGQDKYLVTFTDKDSTAFDPFSYFDGKAIERRLKHNISLSHFTDWPVNEQYVEVVREKVERVTVVTRWFNGMVVWATDEQLAQVQQFSFVKSVESMVPVRAALAYAQEVDTEEEVTPRLEALAYAQLEWLQHSAFQEKNITGKGIRIAVFDAGFPMVDELPAFQHLRDNNKIIKTYDFVAKREDVYLANPHGTMVLSNIAGKHEEIQLGLAIDAEFLLARTERAHKEPFSEEENWLAAAEWADKEGAMIINSSLGYTDKRYKRSEMDGKTSFVTRAANMAASKGILVVNSAGNEGNDDWHIMGAPADADSVLSIGGIDPLTGYHVRFSSFGPTEDDRMKPNVSAMGITAAASRKGGLKQVLGTSFSSPLVAGFAACAWQASPGLTNMELHEKIQQSAHLYPYFDYAHGFGMPQATFFTDSIEEVKPTFEIVEDGMIQVKITTEAYRPGLRKTYPNGKPMDYFPPYDDYLYYHIQLPYSRLDEYFVIAVSQREVLSLDPENYEQGTVIRVWYKNYTEAYTVD